MSKNVVIEIKNLMKKYGFMDAKLEDGTEIKVDGELEEGSEVVVVTEEAELPAPDGEHTLEDGTVVKTEDGVIVDVDKAEEMEDVSVEVEVPEEVAPVVDELVEALLPLLEEVKAIADEMKKMKDKMKSFSKEFESFKKEPAGDKIRNGKTDFNKVITNSVDERAKAIVAMRKR
jgi:hypothetical protein